MFQKCQRPKVTATGAGLAIEVTKVDLLSKETLDNFNNSCRKKMAGNDFQRSKLKGNLPFLLK